MSDEELIVEILSGKKELFEEVLNRYERQILVYTLRLLNFHQQDGEDATSETFVKAYLNLAGFKTSLKFSSWLYRIAHNEAMNIMKKRSKHHFWELSEVIDGFMPATDDWDKPSSEDLEKILAKLKPTDRNLLVLFHLEEKSLREISDILKLSENTIAVKLRRARQRAKKFV